MAARTASTHGERTCTIEVAPNEVDAGAELIVTVRASCPHGCELSGQNVLIRARDDTELARAELGALDDGTFGTALALRAPLNVGEHVCRAVLAAQEKDGVHHAESTTAFSFVTIPHASSVNVWSVPSAIAAGERFSFKVGIKCSAGCRLADRALSITDSDGAQVATGKLCDGVWPGTSALYFAEVEAQAPRTPGDLIWRATSLASEQSVPHAAGSCEFA